MGSSGLRLKEEAWERRAHDTSTGFLSKQLGLSGKLSEEGVEQDPNVSRQFRPDSLPTKERTAHAFFRLYFKLSIFHASFGLKCVGCFFAFKPRFPHLSLNFSLMVPQPNPLPRCPPHPADVCCCWGHSINNFIVLFHSLVPASDGWHFRLLEAGAPAAICKSVGLGVEGSSGTHGSSFWTAFPPAALASALFPFCLPQMWTVMAFSESGAISASEGGQTCPACGRHSLSFRAVFIFGWQEALNGPDTGLGD